MRKQDLYKSQDSKSFITRWMHISCLNCLEEYYQTEITNEKGEIYKENKVIVYDKARLLQ